MAQVSNKPLKQNPFQTIRDPETGRWIVVHVEYLGDDAGEEDEDENKEVSMVTETASAAA
ncbi:MAG: hypothetical protein AB4042_16590 [Leptolyngbyaceae cyanobacterium]